MNITKTAYLEGSQRKVMKKFVYKDSAIVGYGVTMSLDEATIALEDLELAISVAQARYLEKVEEILVNLDFPYRRKDAYHCLMDLQDCTLKGIKFDFNLKINLLCCPEKRAEVLAILKN